MNDSKVNQIFAVNLKNKLAEKHLRPVDLAHALDLSRSSITYWISGHKMPKAKNIDRIASFLNEQPGWFTTDHTVENEGHKVVNLDQDAIFSYHGQILDEQGKKFVLNAAENWLQLKQANQKNKNK